MINTTKMLLGALALAGLSGCVEEAVQLPGVAPPPFITSFDPLVSNAAIDACRYAASQQLTGGVTIMGAEYSEANVAIYMRVGANGAPWRCLVSNDGRGAELMFLGSEGAL